MVKKKYILGIESTVHTFGVDEKVYKLGFANNFSSLRTVTILPGDLCGCRMFLFWGFVDG